MDTLDTQKKGQFLTLLAEGHAVVHACVHSGLARSSAYHLRETDAAFHAAWDDALDAGVEVLEQEAYRRAVQGTDRPIFQGGDLVGTVREYSDTLLIFLLKAKRPGVYREHYRHEHVGADGKEIVVRVDLTRPPDRP